MNVRLRSHPRCTAVLAAALLATATGCWEIVMPELVASVDLTPPADTLEVGETAQLSAIPRDSSGTPMSGHSMTWSSTNSSVARVTAAGLVTAVAAGAAWIIAGSDGASDSAAITVTRASVASVAVSPASATIAVGEAQQLRAVLQDSVGRELTRAVTWHSSNTAVAFVTPGGLVSAVAEGSATITATSEGKSGTAALSVTPPAVQAIMAFPGAQGFGTTTRAGRGGAILRVTNLNDDGPGSLRAAVAATGARTIIFEVSGTIPLASKLRVASPFVTIAGQTAPSPGITLRGAGFAIETHDVLIQHVRVRVGDAAAGPTAGNRDGLEINGTGAYNVVLDHVSASWAIDENGSTWYELHDVTFRNCIISEALSNSIHPEGEHSKGILVGQDATNISIIGSLLAHNMDRNPYFKGNTTVLFVNNVVYNWGSSRATYFDDYDGVGPQSGTVIGNVYVAGVNSAAGRPIRVYGGVKPGSQIFVDDNTFNRAVPPANPWDIVRNDIGAAVIAASPPVWTSPLTVRASGTVESWVLDNAGARPADRDAVDTRIVNEVRSGGGRIIDSQAEVGGWPTLAHTTRPLTPPANPGGDDDGDGYTNLEEWLHQFAAQVEGR